MLGSFAVGKTSLIQRYVKGMFSEKYPTTVGVKIDKKRVTIEDKQVNLILWALAGEWGMDDSQIQLLKEKGWRMMLTSAKTGENMDDYISKPFKPESLVAAISRLARASTDG